MGREGLEPPQSETTDLQSADFSSYLPSLLDPFSSKGLTFYRSILTGIVPGQQSSEADSQYAFSTFLKNFFTLSILLNF